MSTLKVVLDLGMAAIPGAGRPLSAGLGTFPHYFLRPDLPRI